MHVQGLPPPRLTALLGHGWHTRLAAKPLTKVEFTPQLQRLVSTNEFINADSGTIKMLVSSENDYEQRRGEVRAHACPRAA